MTDARIGKVVTIWRYPVKSMRGEPIGSTTFDRRGISGDRILALRLPNGKLGSGKTTRRFGHLPGLHALSARLAADGRVMVCAPGHGELPVGDPRLDPTLSAVLGCGVTVVTEDHVSHLDAAPVHLVTTASLAALRAAMPGTPVDAVRFRPNLVLSCDAPAFAEDDWLGRRLHLGNDVVLEVTARAERCVMVNLASGDAPEAPELLRQLVAIRGRWFGVYAEVRVAGRAAAGDPVYLSGPPIASTLLAQTASKDLPT